MRRLIEALAIGADIIKRSSGQEAWERAANDPTQEAYLWEKGPAWWRDLNRALDKGAFGCFITQLTTPAWFENIERTSTENEKYPQNLFQSLVPTKSKIIAAVFDSLPYTIAIISTDNLWTGVAFKLTCNALYQTVSMLKETIRDKVRDSQAPNTA